MIHVGFTGTRNGCTEKQHKQLREVFRHLQKGLDPVGNPLEVENVNEGNYLSDVVGHHGDCEGADVQFHHLCREFYFDIVVHPPLEDKYQAFCGGAVEVRKPKGYLTRDRDIVDDSHWVIACPKEMEEPPSRRGGGTWATVRYAAGELKKIPPGGARNVLIILPDGSFFIRS